MGGSAWQDVTLGEFVTLQRGHDLPEQDRRPGSVPVAGSFGLTGHHDVARAPGPGVTVGRSGASFGVVNYYPTDYWPLNTALYVVDFHGNDQRFAYYFLQGIDLKRYNSGSAQPSLNRNYIHPIPVRVPPLPEQRAIAHILGTLDDNIELNRRINETLEAMARAIFKSWFVDFDPVRARAEGRQPPGMDAATAALFPDSFQDSELGKIPRGWGVRKLADVAEILMGASPKGDTYNEHGAGVPLINGPVQFGDMFPVREKWTTSPTRLSQRHDLILCVRGSTTGRRVVSDGEYCLGRGVCAVRARDGHQAFVDITVDCELPRMLERTTGSVFPNLSSDDIRTFPVVMPPTDLLHRFRDVVEPLRSRLRANVAEAGSLAATRDALLPRLLSGEVRVKDAERFVVESIDETSKPEPHDPQPRLPLEDERG